MSVRQEVIPFLLAVWCIAVLIVVIGLSLNTKTYTTVIIGIIVGVILSAYMLYFFRDPERVPPSDESLIVAGADGNIARITEVKESKYLNCETVRISIFLSLFDVHVNRSPISGSSRFLGYFPGKRLFTFQEKSSEVNQHNKILIEGEKTKCLVTQIVGPVCRRVVYWPDHANAVQIKKGDRIGMMKFGSRLDMYFPKDDIEVMVKEGDKVRAGETVVARLKLK